MVPLRAPQISWDVSETDVPEPGEISLINHLRFVGLSCRAKARTDLFEACALLSVDKSHTLKTHAEALMRCLNEILGRRAVFYSPGTSEMSFDEAWSARLATSITQGDEASTTFLLHSRAPHIHHRHLRFLISRISEHFSLI